MSGIAAELAGLLAACRSSPADDTPRLVLADWLDEHTDEVPDAAARSSLLRVQVELSRPSNDTARVDELRARQRELVAAHAADWVGDLPRVLRDFRSRHGIDSSPPSQPVSAAPVTSLDALHRYQWGFHRGLLWLWLNPAELGETGVRAWFASDLAPWVGEALVPTDTATLDKLEVSPELAPYVGVRLRVGADAGGTPWTVKFCRGVLASANFGLVRSLRVGPDAVAAGALAMLRKADVSGVRFLNASGGGLADMQAVELADAPLENLSMLDVSGNVIGPAGMKALGNSPHLRRLVSLVAFRNRTGDMGLAALAKSPLANSLTAVSLQNNMIGGQGVRDLCESPLMGRLVGPGLNLSMNRITDLGAKALAGCEHLANFRELILRENAIGSAGAKALAGSPFAANLTYLDLFQNKIGDAGAVALAGSEALAGVRDLSLRGNGIGPKGGRALRERFGDRAKV